MGPALQLFIIANLALISGAVQLRKEALETLERTSSGELDSMLSLLDLSDTVDFLFYSKDFQGHKIIKPNLMARSYVRSDLLDPKKKTKILIHGWMDTGNDSFCNVIKDAYLMSDYDFNIIIVDWTRLAVNLYTFARISVHLVAPWVASLLDHLVDVMGVRPEDLHILGHSLGAHVAGLAGVKMTRGRPARITGMDPALPLFFLGKSFRIDLSNAEFVDIIHTSILGYQKPIGHADFYPNGGGPTQPGCGFNIGGCTHARSYLFYVESITSKRGFVSWSCSSWSDFAQGLCKDNDIEYMGEPTTPKARGVYYLKTAKSSPFALGKEMD